MENNLIKIFKDTVISNHDNGNTINSLIKLNILDIDDLIELFGEDSIKATLETMESQF